MRNSKIIAILSACLLLLSCAKQSSPLGGPIDETPPTLLESSPKTETLNTKPSEIVLTFDEYVKLENATKGIIITPRINKDEVVFTSNKNTVTISLNQELEDSTTYVFDFQKSVVDISEENPVENLKIVFSTGATIDSISLSGKVNFAFPDNRVEFKNVLVGIYPLGDTTDVFTAPPYYLSQVDTAGNFQISNIKNGDYLAYAWKDDNGSLKAEYKSEAYDFLIDTLHLDQNRSDLIFNLSKGDFTPIRILRTANLGKNFDIILNKNPVEVKIENTNRSIDYLYTTSDKRLRIYPKEAIADSVEFKIYLLDSVGFTIDSLIWAKFPETERKPEKLSLTANSGKTFYEKLEMELKFTKPLANINTDSLYVQYDTAGIYKIDPSMYFFEDSLRRDILKIRLNVPDSISKEVFTLKAGDSTFLDIEGMYNETALAANYKKLKGDGLADEITGSITGASPPYILQLIDTKNQVSKEIFIQESNNFSIQLIEPGNYKIRVIEDLNGNRRWDPANYPQRKNAERVFYFKNPETKDEITIRAGWTLADQTIEASPKTGLKQD